MPSGQTDLATIVAYQFGKCSITLCRLTYAIQTGLSFPFLMSPEKPRHCLPSNPRQFPEPLVRQNRFVHDLQVMAPVRSFASSHPGTSVIMMPSTRDVHHHPVFPTPPFDPTETLAGNAIPSQVPQSLPPNIHMLPNPSLFKLGGTVIGAVTTDVLKHLAGQEVFRNAPGQSTDRMACLASHLLGQRR